MEPHPPLLVPTLSLGADHRPEGTDQGERQQVDDVDLAAQLGRRGGDLGADEPGPQHHHPPSGLQRLVQRGRVVNGADPVPPLQWRVEGKPPRPDSGGDDEPSVCEHLAARDPVERDGVRVEVRGDHRLTEPPGHVGGTGPLPVLQGGRVDAVLERVLGQGRPVVGRMDLPADDDDRPGVAGRAELLSRAEPGEAGPDDDDGGRHVGTPSSSR